MAYIQKPVNDRYIGLRVDADLLADLRADAARTGLKFSEVARQRLRAGKAALEQEEARS